MKRSVINLLCVTLLLQCLATAQSSDPSLQRLEREILRISKVAGGLWAPPPFTSRQDAESS